MSKAKGDGFQPFKYGQRVKWLETTADATAQEYYHEGKVQGTVSSKPEYLFVVDGAGKGHEVLKARLLDNEPADNNDEKQDDENPKVNPTAQKYDTGEVVELGDLIASEGGVPGRVVELIGECRDTIGTMFTGNSCIYWRSPKGLQFVQRGKLADVPVIPPHAAGLGSNHKETNPKDALAGKKPRWFSYLPIRVLIGVGVAMYEGARKYGRHNYRPAGVRASVYVDAVVSGHLMPWWEGEDIDAESGRSHIDKAIASLMVLRDSMYEGNWIDDRPPAAKNLPEILAEAGDAWAQLQERHPDPVAPWTQRRIEGKE